MRIAIDPGCGELAHSRAWSPPSTSW